MLPNRSDSPVRPACRLHQAPTQPVDPEEDQPEHPQEPPVPEPGLPVIRSWRSRCPPDTPAPACAARARRPSRRRAARG